MHKAGAHCLYGIQNNVQHVFELSLKPETASRRVDFLSCRAYNIAGRAREVIETNLKAVERRLTPPVPTLSSSLTTFFSSSPSPTALDPKVESQVCLQTHLVSVGRAGEHNLDQASVCTTPMLSPFIKKS